MKGRLELARTVFGVILLITLLSGCRGGVLVFNGTHESQDAAMLSKLRERYPQMGFECTGRTGGGVHSVEASDGTEFPAWTAAKSKGEFQVLEYYMEEWLAARGYYDKIEGLLEEQGCGYEYGSYNHYERHFQLELGPLDSEEQLEKAAKAVGQVKAEFDSLRQEFEESTGCRDLLLYFHGSYTLGGEEHHGTFHLSMREGDSWGRDYPFYDYRSYLEECIEKTGDIPNID
ncbi:hypothetical protein [Acutalibacter sp. 1XD8-36]|uniref:hypothetical protein n=1 Tax=Acutalibacter sp. 1XD8-36 TaxID=2320852 RepID=UPI00261994FF|nr:hypothetical protein [Acutalibacter sp. 1XD8-36]